MTTCLKCVFRVENDGKAVGRPANGFVALGCERKGMCEDGAKRTFYLLLTTRLNKGHPRKIKLDNFHSLFDKMKRNGMATFQFVDPKLTVYVSQIGDQRLDYSQKADSKKLSQFLLHLNGLLRRRADRNCAAVGFSSLSSSSQMQCPPIPSVSTVHRQCTSSISSSKPIKLCIQSRQQYQSLIKQGSATLQRLDIVGIGFCTVDIRWFAMCRLQQLSLVANNLGSDDWCTERNWRRFSAISKLKQLNTLDLSQNEFKYLHEMFIDALPVSLVHLNLASNRLIRLTNRISRLQKLDTLRLDENAFDELPEDLCLIGGLRELSLVGLKQLQFLPASLCVVKFSTPPRFNLLDISRNEHAPFITGRREQNVDKFGTEKVAATISAVTVPPPLCKWAAAAVLNNKRMICPNSCLLRPSVADCLPSLVCHSMRQWFRRCAFCNRLFNFVALSSSNNGISDHDNNGQFKRVDLRRCSTSLYGGCPFAFYRVQLCRQCCV